MAMLFSSCAYYNSFYNAEKAFESAQNRALNAQGRPSSQAIEEYNSVVRKCGYILTEYKNSRWADDALFLMGRALYYRGQNQVQALDAFSDLMMYYPDSPHFNDAILYSARLRYELNEQEEAFSALRAFISDSSKSKDHPKALTLIADLYILDKNFSEAQNSLSVLIELFPKSTEYPEAYKLLGITYFDNENYTKSLEIFQEITTKKMKRTYHLDAMYYIAYNYFELGDYERAYQTIRTLQRREFRLSELAAQEILHARIIAEMNREEDAIEKLELVITNNARTEYSASSSYYIAEIQFRKLHQYEEAIENYNRVRRELPRSEFADISVQRSAVASQILQYHRSSTSWTAEQLIAEQFKLAEFYLYELALPDSALFVYSQMPQQMFAIEAKLDSLWVIVDTGFEEIEDLFVPLVYSPEYIEENSLESTPDEALEDLMQTITMFENDFYMYMSQFVPQSYFMRIVVLSQLYDDEDQVAEIMQILESDYPDNRYTESAREFLNDEKVTFMTRLEKQQMERYDYAMSYYLEDTSVYMANLGYIIGLLESIKET